MSKAFIALPAVLALVACGQGPAPLDGSLVDFAPNDFTYTVSTIAMVQNTLVLRFQRARGTQFDTVLKVAVEIDGPAPDHPEQFDLAEMVNGGPRGVASRNVYMDMNSMLPPIMRGNLALSGAMAGQTKVAGTVSMTFVQGDVYGSGRAIFGPFDAEVVMQ